MHLLQVRRQRGGREARRRLYTAFKRRQREDLCFPLVLVPFPRRAQFLYGFVQGQYPKRLSYFANNISVVSKKKCNRISNLTKRDISSNAIIINISYLSLSDNKIMCLFLYCSISQFVRFYHSRARLYAQYNHICRRS